MTPEASIPNSGIKVTPEEQRNRYRISKALNLLHILPAKLRFTRQQDSSGNWVSTLEEAERLHEEGCGMVFLYNHFDRTDPLLALYIPYGESKKLSVIPTLSPIEQQQFEQNEGLLTFLTSKTGGTLKPMVTEDTTNQYGVPMEGEEKNVFISKTGEIMHETDGFMEYITAAKDTLREGGSVLLPITAGRRPSLHTSRVQQDPKSRDRGPLSALNIRMGGKPETARKVAVAFIGIGLDGTKDYTKARGFNFGKRATITLGAVVTLEELRALAYTFDTTIDEVGRSFLDGIVPAAYRYPQENTQEPIPSPFARIKTWISQRFSGSPEQS